LEDSNKISKNDVRQFKKQFRELRAIERVRKLAEEKEAEDKINSQKSRASVILDDVFLKAP